MQTHTQNHRREILFACPRCLERDARELERQGFTLDEIASALNVTLRAVGLLLKASEVER